MVNKQFGLLFDNALGKLVFDIALLGSLKGDTSTVSQLLPSLRRGKHSRIAGLLPIGTLISDQNYVHCMWRVADTTSQKSRWRRLIHKNGKLPLVKRLTVGRAKNQS